MYTFRSYARISAAVSVVLVVLLSTPNVAVPGTGQSDQVAELTANQMGLLKEESGDFSTHHHVRVVSTDLTFIEAAKESGAGGYVDIRKSLTTGFNVVDSVMKAEAQTGSNNDPPPLAPWHRKKSITYALGGWFADLYLGPSITQDDNLEVRASGAEESSEDIDYDISITFGGRLGYWAWKAPQAATALDVSTYQADAKGINTSVYSVSLLAMFRHPGQELQPYIGIGPSLFITNFKLRVDLSAVNPGQTETVSDTSYDVGLDTRAGLAFQFRPNIAWFMEYRFTHYRPEYKETISGVKVEVETDYNTHHIVTGVSYRF